MSSSYSANSARSGELPEKNELIWNYSGDSESLIVASSSRESVRGQEEASTSGQEERALEDSPLDDLFAYKAPAYRQRVESPDIESPTRALSTEFQEGVGTSRPRQTGGSPANDQRLEIVIPQLRDESPTSLQIKIEECDWAYNALLEKERAEAWIGSRAPEVKTVKKRKRRPPPGATWCTEESLDTLRTECGIPEDVELIKPSDDQREDRPPPGTFTAYEVWFRGCYLTFPIQAVILRFMIVHRIALAQINSRGVRQLVGILTRGAECGEAIGFRHLFNLLVFSKQNNSSGKNLYNLASRHHYKVIDGFPNKDHDWRKYFFFVPISAASVELEDPRLAKWGTLGRFLMVFRASYFLVIFLLLAFYLVFADKRPFGTPVPRLKELVEKLSARRCLWKHHFYLRRVIRARRTALVDEEAEPSRSTSKELEVMQERKTFRDLKKKTKKPKKVIVADAATSGVEVSEQSVAKDKTPIGDGGEVAAAQATTPLAVTPIDVDDEPDEAENQLERRKRKLSAADKGKGIEGAEKRTRRKLPTLPTLPEGAPIPRGAEIYDDPSAAASLMAKITYPGDNSPIPDMLMMSDLYNEYSFRQTKALAHLNRMIVSYDQAARSRQLFIDEAKVKEEAEKKRVAENTARLNAELEAEKRSSIEMLKHLQRLNDEKKKDDEKLAELEQQMLVMKASHERDLEAAVSEARRTAVAEVKTQLNSAHELYEKLRKRPFNHMVYYSQAEANLQLLADVEKGQADGTFDLAAERAELVESKAKFAKANDAYDRIAAELRKTLGMNYVVPANVRDLVYSPRLETIAKSVGVITASGSNDGSLGMRLLQDDESSSDSDESQESEPRDIDETPAQAQGDVQAQEVATALRQSELAPSNPVAEKTTVEAASSATAAAQAEGIEKEAGEL